METTKNTIFPTRLGLHYFPDTGHYRESDLHTWLPELQNLGVNWLTLVAPQDRAIPEPFLTGLLEAGIEPVLHFQLPLAVPLQTDSLNLLFSTYNSWGIRYVVLFDRPNSRSAWPINAWAQTDLVERFLDIYLPLAESSLQAGLKPVFPPLEPGGDYWDTAFLRAALQGMERRGCSRLLQSLVLSAYGRVEGRPLNWGVGGPERWPGARPYFTPAGQQDQRGFYIFDWYLALAQAVLRQRLPMLILGAGSRIPASKNPAELEQNLAQHAAQNLALWKLAAGSSSTGGAENQASGQVEFLEPLPSQVLACNFWLLSASMGSPEASQAWFLPEGEPLPVIGALRAWKQNREPGAETSPAQPGKRAETSSAPKTGSAPECVSPNCLISHYLLLPTYEWGIADWHLDVIRPFVKKYRPTIGFSLEEASHAAQVTVIGGTQVYPDEALESLSRAGCRVERISGDGTSIATQLAER